MVVILGLKLRAVLKAEHRLGDKIVQKRENKELKDRGVGIRK